MSVHGHMVTQVMRADPRNEAHIRAISGNDLGLAPSEHMYYDRLAKV